MIPTHEMGGLFSVVPGETATKFGAD